MMNNFSYVRKASSDSFRNTELALCVCVGGGGGGGGGRGGGRGEGGRGGDQNEATSAYCPLALLL